MDDPSVLELSTIRPERRRARLRTPENPEGLRPDGKLYELLSPEELSLVQLHELETEQSAITEMWKEDPAAAEAAINKVVGLVILDAPPADIAQLSFLTKAEVMQVFAEAVTSRLPTPTPAPVRRKQPVG